ncbi:hypothetical protein S40288_05149 [Stachybotrys chartarum IBT 40288]|nr:hypothetical protein S40288_05149 [Stachybotrys chartarum IBT 40288]
MADIETTTATLYDSILGGRFLSQDAQHGQHQRLSSKSTGFHPPSPMEEKSAHDTDSTAAPSLTESENVLDDAQAGSGRVPDIKTVIEYADSEGKHHVVGFENYKFSQEAPAAARNATRHVDDERFKHFPILLKAVINHTQRNLAWHLEIQSPHLLAIFREIAVNFKELRLDADQIVIPHPFRSLFFLRHDLQALLERPSNPKIQSEVHQLLDFIGSPICLGNKIQEYSRLVEKRSMVTFPSLWTLYRPYEPVICTQPGQRLEDGMCYLVQSLGFDVGKDRPPQWQMKLLCGYHDGTTFQIRAIEENIPYFNGIRHIDVHEIRMVPIRLLEENNRLSLEKSLIERGKSYINYCSSPYTFCHYNGNAQLRKKDQGKVLDGWTASTISVDERFVLDRTAEGKLSTHNSPGNLAGKRMRDLTSCPAPTDLSNVTNSAGNARQGVMTSLSDLVPSDWNRPSDAAPGTAGFMVEDPKKVLTDIEYMMCCNTTTGFALTQKLWLLDLHINQLSKIKFKPNPFNALQLPAYKKQYVRRLLEGFRKGKNSVEAYDDVIEGKGQGLIFLLYGPPGLGKTLTAESVAEITQRPLYHVSAGELGSTVTEVETRLEGIFQVGARWDAVVLLDEADVLMSRRTPENLKRNTIVTVFLRMLEYYKGMLFLTTNRPRDFDDAFQNRLHVTLEYSDLDAPARTNIWRDHITRSAQKNKTYQWTADMYEALGQLSLNGRDIKNCVRTAYAYTKAVDGEDLGIGQILRVLKNNLPQDTSLHRGLTAAEVQERRRMIEEMETAERITEAFGV